MKQYKSIFISDIHLGTRDCQATALVDFLKHNRAHKLYLVGDILDAWKIKQNKWAWKKDHTDVVVNILRHAKQGTEVIYITGNHDEFIRPFIEGTLGFGLVKMMNHTEHLGADGKRYLVIHGDMFDGIADIAPYIATLGDKAYDFLLLVNGYFNWFRRKLGFGYWSLSKYLKIKVKDAVNFICKFESNLSEYAKKRGFDGVICGHIHHAEIKHINGIKYMNDGDWVESRTALVEHFNGTWEIITWGVNK